MVVAFFNDALVEWQLVLFYALIHGLNIRGFVMVGFTLQILNNLPCFGHDYSLEARQDLGDSSAINCTQIFVCEGYEHVAVDWLTVYEFHRHAAEK